MDFGITRKCSCVFAALLLVCAICFGSMRSVAWADTASQRAATAIGATYTLSGKAAVSTSQGGAQTSASEDADKASSGTEAAPAEGPQFRPWAVAIAVFLFIGVGLVAKFGRRKQ